jgi:hypothetical protein
MMSRVELPEPVAVAIMGLNSAEKAEIASAHSLLQIAMLGGPGCLRTDLPARVPWANAVGSEFIALPGHRNNHVRSIAGQMLSNLARSADLDTTLRDLPKVVAATRDPMFVTGRHILQAIWKFALDFEVTKNALLTAFTQRLENCIGEKNSSLIRHDIVVGLRLLYNHSANAGAMKTASQLIALEGDAKYRKKCASVWRDVIDARRD